MLPARISLLLPSVTRGYSPMEYSQSNRGNRAASHDRPSNLQALQARGSPLWRWKVQETQDLLFDQAIRRWGAKTPCSMSSLIPLSKKQTSSVRYLQGLSLASQGDRKALQVLPQKSYRTLQSLRHALATSQVRTGD